MEQKTSLRPATPAELDATTTHPELRTHPALRQMVADGQVDADVARADRRRDWPLRIDADNLRAEIRLGLRDMKSVAAEFHRRGMPIRTAVRLLAKGRVAA